MFFKLFKKKDVLDINNIIPQKGILSCNLFENKNINLPLQLFYSIEIPLKSFDTGHTYIDQPSETSFLIEWIRFSSNHKEQEKNWKNLDGKKYSLSYEEETAEGSIYLGTEHCYLNSQIHFKSLERNIFEIELAMAIDFNRETTNLPKDGIFHLKTTLEFEGLCLYDKQSLPTLSKVSDKIKLVNNYIDRNVYEKKLVKYENPNVNWELLKPLL